MLGRSGLVREACSSVSFKYLSARVHRAGVVPFQWNSKEFKDSIMHRSNALVSYRVAPVSSFCTALWCHNKGDVIASRCTRYRTWLLVALVVLVDDMHFHGRKRLQPSSQLGVTIAIALLASGVACTFA